MAFGYQILGFGSGAAGGGGPYIVACGGCQTTDGDYYIHKFEGDGTLTLTSAGTCRACCVGDNKMDYLIVAGGGGATASISGGGGGGGGSDSGSAVSGSSTSISIGITTSTGAGSVGAPFVSPIGLSF